MHLSPTLDMHRKIPVALVVDHLELLAHCSTGQGRLILSEVVIRQVAKRWERLLPIPVSFLWLELCNHGHRFFKAKKKTVRHLVKCFVNQLVLTKRRFNHRGTLRGKPLFSCRSGPARRPFGKHHHNNRLMMCDSIETPQPRSPSATN